MAYSDAGLLNHIVVHTTMSLRKKAMGDRTSTQPEVFRSMAHT